jgi:hypothetical protein
MSTLKQRQYPNQQRISDELARARYAERVEAERLAAEEERAYQIERASRVESEIDAKYNENFEEIPLLEEGPLSQAGMYNSAEIAAGNLARGVARSIVGGAVESAVGGGALGYTARAVAGGVAGNVANSAGRGIARQVPMIASRLGGYYDRVYRVFRPVFRPIVDSPMVRVLGRGVKDAMSAEAGVALAMGELTYKALNMIFDEQDLEKRKKKMRDQGYLVLDSEGTHEVQPRGDESLSKYTQVPANPTERKKGNKPTTPKEPIIYVTPEPVTPDQTKAPIIPPREPPITPTTPVSPPTVVRPPPVRPPTTVTPPVRPPTTVTPPVRPPTTVTPPVIPPTTVTPPTIVGSDPKMTDSFQIVTHQQGQSNRGLYMGPRPVKPIHYRIPNDRPYDMVDWERGARAKALAMVQ